MQIDSMLFEQYESLELLHIEDLKIKVKVKKPDFLFLTILTLNKSSALAPQSEVQVQPFGVVVSGSATSSLGISKGSSLLLDENGQPAFAS